VAVRQAPNNSIRRELEAIVEAFEAAQEDRRRDGIYPYLSRVLRLVRRYGSNKRVGKLIRQVEKFAKLSAPTKVDPFSFIIRCTSDPDVVNDQLRSKYARALRYAARFKRRESLQSFSKARGGINGLATRYAARIGAGKKC
jgi:hypothetical protein